MLKSRLLSAALCAILLMVPGWRSAAEPTATPVPTPPKPSPFVTVEDGWSGYWMMQWKTGTWKHQTYAGLWTPGAVPNKGDLQTWAEARIAKEIVGIKGLTVEPGLFARLAKEAAEGHKHPVLFRHDPKATHTSIYYKDEVVIRSADLEIKDPIVAAFNEAVDVATNYDVHKGWVAGSFFRTIASPMEHPVDASAMALELGCDWVIWAYGQQDHLTAAHADRMIRAATPAGEQAMLTLQGQTFSRGPWHHTKEPWGITVLASRSRFDYQDITHELKYYVDRAQDGGGHVFANAATYKSLAARNKRRQFKKPITFAGVDSVDPALLQTSPFIGRGGRNITPGKGPNPPTAMAVLTPKGKPLTEKSLFEGIAARRAIHLREEKGRTVVAGPDRLVKAFGLLLLSRTYLETNFKTDLQVRTQVTGWDKLTVTVANRSAAPFAGSLKISTAGGDTPLLAFPDLPKKIELAAGKTATYTSKITYGTHVSGQDLAILTTVLDKAGKPYKRALARVAFPKALVGLPTLALAPGKTQVPFTLWNLSGDKTVPYTVQIRRGAEASPPASKSATIAPYRSGQIAVELDAAAGDTFVTVRALGQTKTTHLVVRKQKGGKIKHWFKDMNDDGKQELFVENDHVKAVFLLQGARLIRYWNKKNGDNVFAEIWPENPEKRKKETDRSFWPYGGLEEFITYPKIDAHTWYKHRIVRDDGKQFTVEFTATVHGQKIKKFYTLYAGSGLLEMRYAFEFNDPSVHMIGVNPILSIGTDCDAHDVSIFPTKNGIATHRFDPDRMHGGKYDLTEGWAASYDEREKSTLIQSFPLKGMLFMHLWNNTPQNSSTHYFYTELQPWFLTDIHTTTYYSYYILPHAGPWQDGLKKMKSLGITPEKKVSNE